MADKRAIHEFATGQGHFNSLLLMDNPDSTASSGYTTESLPISDLGIVISTLLYQQRLDTNVKTIFGGINELFARVMNIASDYDDTKTYNTDDLCFYQNVLYKCNDDNVTGTWDATKWGVTTIADELANGGGGGSGGYPVLYGTTDPTSAQGSDGQLYAKYETVNNVTSVIAMWLKIQSDWCSIVMSSGGDVGIECTQAQYDAWEQAGTLLEDTNYYITDGQSGGGVVIDDTTASTTTVYSSDKVEDLLGDKADASTTYTKTEVDTALSGKQDELTFITLTIDGSDLATTQIPNGTIRDIFYNLDISSKLPTGKKVKMFTVATSNPTTVIARQWISGDNKISVSLGNLTTTTITITAITIQCLCI